MPARGLVPALEDRYHLSDAGDDHTVGDRPEWRAQAARIRRRAPVHQEPGFLAKSGEYESCTNDYGVYDMVGNLHEWIADGASKNLMKEIPIEYGSEMLGAKGSGVFIGGYFSSHGEHGRGCAYVTATHSPDYHDYSIGFRCCAEARAESAGDDGDSSAPR